MARRQRGPLRQRPDHDPVIRSGCSACRKENDLGRVTSLPSRQFHERGNVNGLSRGGKDPVLGQGGKPPAGADKGSGQAIQLPGVSKERTESIQEADWLADASWTGERERWGECVLGTSAFIGGGPKERPESGML